MRRLALVLLGLAALAPACSSDEPAATAPRLRLPYDVEVDARGRIYVADGLLHRVLRHDPATGETVVVAGTGERGSTGDGGPALEATLDEPVGLALDADGALYLADFPANRIRRIDPSGRITTLAKLELPAAVALHPDGRSVAVPTLGNDVYGIDLESGAVETVAPAESPHGAAYDDEGNLYFPDGHRLRRIDAENGVVETVAEDVDATKVLVGPDGSLYLVGGDPGGGQIRRIAPDGTIETVVGTGSLGDNGEGWPATEIGILPSDVAVAPDGALVFSQTAPEPAVRRVDPATGLVTTLVR